MRINERVTFIVKWQKLFPSLDIVAATKNTRNKTLSCLRKTCGIRKSKNEFCKKYIHTVVCVLTQNLSNKKIYIKYCHAKYNNMFKICFSENI